MQACCTAAAAAAATGIVGEETLDMESILSRLSLSS
jgi:hypothetical protein